LKPPGACWATRSLRICAVVVGPCHWPIGVSNLTPFTAIFAREYGLAEPFLSANHDMMVLYFLAATESDLFLASLHSGPKKCLRNAPASIICPLLNWDSEIIITRKKENKS